MSAVLSGDADVGTPRSTTGDVDRPIVEPNKASATERLEASRARLRTALLEIAHPPPKPSLLGDLKIGSLGHQLMERLKSLPGAALILESVERWWADHPLHAAGSLAEQASRRYVGPIAEKNPYAVIVGGVVFGALLAASKPWRWLLRPALFFGLVPQIAAQVMKRMPLDAWLQMLSAVGGPRAAGKAPSPSPSPNPTSRPVASPAPGLPARAGVPMEH